MKKLHTILVALLITTNTFAQVPEKMSYQAIIRDSDDNLVTSQLVGMQISILQGDTAVYVETQISTTNINGLLSIEIGGVDAIVVLGDFSAINWSSGTYFIKTETDPSGGNIYTITGTSQLLSVPYSLHAKTAETVTGTCNLSIGDTYKGGIIFYLDSSGCHGLVAKATDEPGVYQWSETFLTTNAFASEPYSGNRNTKRITTLTSPGKAANVCADLTDGGFDDWYLPSIGELDLMYWNLHLQGFGGFIEGTGEFVDPDGYFSSTEKNNIDSRVLGFSFVNGNIGDQGKVSFRRVRAVRAF